MSKKQKNIIILLVLLVLFSIFAFYFYKIPRNILNQPKEETKENNLIQKAILEIEGKKYETEIETQMSISDFMEKLKNEGKISFTEKNYTGMGKFIESINNIKNSGEKNWIYYVNGEKANIGVSNYKIINGDIVSWKYEKENF